MEPKPGTDLWHRYNVFEQERKVIEAARALRDAMERHGHGFCLDEIGEVCNSVDALDAAERGE